MLYLVDASVYVFRAYYSMPPEMKDRDGNPAHALFGFARFIGDLLERAKPRYAAVAFDGSLATSFRNRIYPAYKANREPAPHDLLLQFERCREFCRHLGLAEFASLEYEADDIIGTLAARTRALDERVVVVTRDKDMAQLIRPGDQYWDYIDDRRFNYDQIAERFGVLPERMACFLALMGDAVDNIPGVPGVGRKTASMLFKHFESLPHLYDNLDRVLQLKLRNSGFVVGQLRDYRERAFLARRLTQIACEMPLEVTWDGLARRAPDLDALNRFFDSVGFGRLLRNQAERILQAA